MKRSSSLALLPFGIFLLIFSMLNIYYFSTEIIHDNFPICAAFIALCCSFFTFAQHETWNKKVEIFIAGACQPIVIHMCFIFYFSTIFTAILEQSGGISAAVELSLACIPSWSVLPGMFMVASMFSFTVGTSMGAIAAFMPIAISITKYLAINPSLMAATIVCGAMFGDNLSILSDTTIASVAITKTTMSKKLWLNTKIAIPAFFATILVLIYQNHLAASSMIVSSYRTLHIFEYIQIVPYLLTFYLAFTGLDILIVLIIGIIAAISIGLYLQTLTILQSINILFDGFYLSKGMVNVVILVLLLSGLSKIISHNGGINYLINTLEYKLQSKTGAKLVIFLLITIINMTIAINTIAIIMSGPVAKKISDDYTIKAEETACILDIGSCVSQGILPYSPQLLLAASMAQVSAISLLPYLYYQFFLGISLFLTIIWRHK